MAKRKKLSNNDIVANDNSLSAGYNVLTLSSLSKPYFENYRYVIEYGGRGSGKSYRAAQAAVLLAYNKKNLILCARAILKSIEDSVKAEIVARIEGLGLEDEFIIKKTEIICKHNGSRIFFKGLDRNINSIKSITNVDILWIEEADILTKSAWLKITPTIRKAGSKIWITFNPNRADDVIYEEFIGSEPPENTYIKKSHWSENPYLSKEFHIDREKLLRTNPALYPHVYDGELFSQSEALIYFGKFRVAEFKEDKQAVKYIGLDFGYSQDPVAAVRCYIDEEENKLYITHEAVKKKLDIDHIGEFCKPRIPDFQRTRILADNSAPAVVNFMKRQGYRVEGAEKGKGSIVEGIAFINSFDEIIIDPACKETIKEMSTYSYIIDKRTDEITNKPEDKNNHCMDALRYALRKVMIKRLANYRMLTKNM